MRDATIKRQRRMKEILPPAKGLYMLKSDLRAIDLKFWAGIPPVNRPAILKKYPELIRGLAEQEAIEKQQGPRPQAQSSLEATKALARSIGAALYSMVEKQAE